MPNLTTPPERTTTGENLDNSWFRRNSAKVRTAILIGVLIAMAGGGGWVIWSHTRSSKDKTANTTTTPSTSPTPTPTPATVPAPLTGVPVSPSIAASPLFAVVIENHPDARPQSGLSQAGVVYEANAEGGITRFLAFFQDTRPAILGPVRSLRTYFVDWALEFNAPVAHAGGNADALDLVAPLHMKDINALSFASAAFYRTTDRVAPHNLYTTYDKLTAMVNQLGFGQAPNFQASPRKPDQPSTAPAHPNIHINFSYNGYQVDYKYDAAHNDYARFLAGAPHIDRLTGQQIHVKNVVVEMMPTSYGTTRIGESTVIMQTVGQGQGWVLHDGGATPTTWKKTSHNARTQLIGPDGKDTPLDVGNTWYAIVPAGNSVTF